MDPLFWLAIVIIIALVILFIVSFVLNKRTPVPEGCEHIKISDEFCLNCTNEDCKIHEKLDLDQIKKDLEGEENHD